MSTLALVSVSVEWTRPLEPGGKLDFLLRRPCEERKKDV